MIKLFRYSGFWTLSLLSTSSLFLMSAGNWLEEKRPPAIQPETPAFKPLSPFPSAKERPTASQMAAAPTPVVPRPAAPPSQSASYRAPTAPTLTAPNPATTPAPATTRSPSPSPKAVQPRPQRTAPVAPTPTPQLEIRVMLQQDASSVTVGTSSPASVLAADGQPLLSLAANQGTVVQAAGESLLVGEQLLPAAIWVQPSAAGFFYLNERWYRGKLLLVSQGSTILAVNFVDLEDYLYSVVGSEMHADAHPEALKAQAIAARSYALVHLLRPASSWYNLGATQRWQAYKGLGKEYNTTHQAVNETRGEILSYQGGVVESLYAATEEIVARAHGGRGMSQTGAYRLANQGYDYRQILGFYYPGVELARLSK